MLPYTPIDMDKELRSMLRWVVWLRGGRLGLLQPPVLQEKGDFGTHAEQELRSSDLPVAFWFRIRRALGWALLGPHVEHLRISWYCGVLVR